MLSKYLLGPVVKALEEQQQTQETVSTLAELTCLTSTLKQPKKSDWAFDNQKNK